MTVQAILLRPLGAQHAPQMAAVLAGCFASVVLLAMLAVDSRTALRTPEVLSERTGSPASRATAQMQPPAGSLRFHLASGSAGDDPTHLLDPGHAEEFLRWQRYLRDHPSDRLLLTLASAPGTPPHQVQRVGAALVRLLAGQDLNPHRLRLAVAMDGDAATEGLTPAEFRLSLELGAP